MSSEVDLETEVETSADGVTVRKRFEAEEFPVPAIRFVITSDHDERVSVSLAEKIPGEFPMDSVGFHPDYDSDNWTAFQDHHVEYQRTLEPGEEVVTVYGIRIDSPEEATKFLDEPEIANVSTEPDEDDAGDEGMAETTIDDIASAESDRAVKDMIAGDDEALPGLEDDAADAAESDEADLDLDLDADEEEAENEDSEIDIDVGETEDEAEAADEADPEADVDGEAEAEDGADGDAAESDDAEADATPGIAADAPGDGSLVAALVAELDGDAVSAADRRALRSALDAEPSGTDVAKVEHLQSRVEEVAAYADALEEFLDEEGTAQQLVEEFRADVASLQTEVDDLAESLESQAGRVEDVESTVEAYGDRIDATESRVEERTAELEADLTALDDRADDIESELDERTGDLDDRMSDLSDSVAATDGDVADVREELESLREEVDEIQEWRSQLGEMFGE